MNIKEAESKLNYAISLLEQALPPRQMNEIKNAYEMARVAMDRQEPVKPFRESLDDYLCPLCGCGLYNEPSNTDYFCPNCGHPISWEGNKQ